MTAFDMDVKPCHIGFQIDAPEASGQTREAAPMSKAEVERFINLLEAWNRGYDGSQGALLAFLATYRQPLANALRFYAADK